jgi:outer membrane lipoprotein-sorting protein
VNIFRRLSLPKLLALCAIVVVVGASATALASALDTGPVPPAKPLAQAVHDALGGPAVQGFSANITLTNHLLEGANLASGGDGQTGALSSPLLNGGSGRLWISDKGQLRLELQAEKGDTEIYYDGSTVSAYDASTNTLYKLKPPHEGTSTPDSNEAAGQDAAHEPPSVAKIEEGIAKVREHADLSGATPGDVAGQPAYTVRVSPKEAGSLIAGAELSFDAAHGVPLRAAVYSTSSSAPVLELAATEVSYGAVDPSVFSFSPPPNAKIEEVSVGEGHPAADRSPDAAQHPRLTAHGHGIAAIEVLEGTAHAGQESSSGTESLPTVDINGAKASELRTALGTILSFERSGVRYVVAGAVSPAAVEALARGL